MNKTLLKNLEMISHLKGTAFIFLGVVFIALGLNGLLRGMEPIFLVTGMLACGVGGLRCVEGFEKNRKKLKQQK